MIETKISKPVKCGCGGYCYWVDNELMCSQCGTRNYRMERVLIERGEGGERGLD